MSKLSKGEWYVDSAEIVRCNDEYDRSIARLITLPSTKKLDDANARLIVNAPDMYNLLEALIEAHNDVEISDVRLQAKPLLARIDGLPHCPNCGNTDVDWSEEQDCFFCPVCATVYKEDDHEDQS